MKIRLISIILALIFLFSLTNIVFATETSDPTTKISAITIDLQSSYNLVYYVESSDVPSGSEEGLLVWNTPQTTYEIGSQNFKTTSFGTLGEYKLFSFDKISMVQVSDEFYAVSYVKVGDNCFYSKPIKYSIFQYLFNKRNSTETMPDGETLLKDFVNVTLQSLAMGQKAFGYHMERYAGDDYCEVIVDGGTLPDGFSKGLYKVGSKVTITATEDSVKWFSSSDSYAASVSNLKQYEITVPDAESITYKAVKNSGYSEGLEYQLFNDTSYRVTGIGTCKDTTIIIPSTHEGKPVDRLGAGCFSGLQNYTIYIPSSITRFGSNPFSSCKNITLMFESKTNNITSGWDEAYESSSEITIVWGASLS